MMQLSKKIPFDDPQVLLGVRTLYVASNILIVGLYLYVRMQINKKKGLLSYLFQLFDSFSLIFFSVFLLFS